MIAELLVSLLYAASPAPVSEPVFLGYSCADENHCVVVVRGFPKKRSEGKAALESAQRSAMLNLYYFGKKYWALDADAIRKGEVVKYTVRRDAIVLHYRLKTPGIKKRLGTIPLADYETLERRDDSE